MATGDSLGQWALIDIETSGIDSSYDQILDIGFLQFDGSELVRTYESLVRYDAEVPHIIKKLTGFIRCFCFVGICAWLLFIGVCSLLD